MPNHTLKLGELSGVVRSSSMHPGTSTLTAFLKASGGSTRFALLRSHIVSGTATSTAPSTSVTAMIAHSGIVQRLPQGTSSPPGSQRQSLPPRIQNFVEGQRARDTPAPLKEPPKPSPLQSSGEFKTSRWDSNSSFFFRWKPDENAVRRLAPQHTQGLGSKKDQWGGCKLCNWYPCKWYTTC